jgi:hypothetical protein
MKKSLFILLLFISIQLPAQITLTGKVVERNTKQPLEFATIILTNPNTNEVVAGESTNSQGEFLMNIKKGQYD